MICSHSSGKVVQSERRACQTRSPKNALLPLKSEIFTLQCSAMRLFSNEPEHSVLQCMGNTVATKIGVFWSLGTWLEKLLDQTFDIYSSMVTMWHVCKVMTLSAERKWTSLILVSANPRVTDWDFKMFGIGFNEREFYSVWRWMIGDMTASLWDLCCFDTTQ